MQNRTECQEAILHLLLNHPELINEFSDVKIDVDFFDPIYKPLLQGVYHSNQKSIRLTENNYLDFIEQTVVDGRYAEWTQTKVTGPTQPRLKEKQLFVPICNFKQVAKDDFQLLAKKLREYYVKDETKNLFQKFKATNHSSFMEAITDLSDELNKLVASQNSSNVNMMFIDDCAPEFMEQLKEERTNPTSRLVSGISELDESMTVGFYPGSLTTIVADVGAGKTTMMINIAINVNKIYKENVLFISLEMPWQKVMEKIVCRESGVKLSKVARPETLDEVEVKRLDDEWKKWNNDYRFAILDFDERASLAEIRSKIERNISFFKPRLVVVDYISILLPEKFYAHQKPFEWVGHICKGLRVMGKKYGFATLSAAQLGRDAIKRMRGQKEGKQTAGSEDIRGGHDFSADSDNVYALVANPENPNNKLQLFCIKARYGSTLFSGNIRALLDFNKDIGRITGSTDATWGYDDIETNKALKYGEETQAKMTFVDDDDLDLDGIGDKPLEKPKPEKKEMPSKRKPFIDFD